MICLSVAPFPTLFYFTRSLLVWLSYRDLVICWAHSPEIGEAVVIGSVEDPERKVREWLLLLLRFAVTRDVPDWTAALALARELDTPGHRFDHATPGFFVRTTGELCGAIRSPGDEHARSVIRTHLGRIDDQRLRKAFAAAADLDETADAAVQPVSQRTPRESIVDKRRRALELWRGLGKCAQGR